MTEVRRGSSSSLQRKKPPWLKLDIPAAPFLAPAEEAASLQVPGRLASQQWALLCLSAMTLQLLLPPQSLGGPSVGLGNSLGGLHGNWLRSAPSWSLQAGGVGGLSGPLRLAASADAWALFLCSP